MFKNKLTTTSLILLIVLLLSGCAQRIGDFTVISTKNYEASKKYTKVGRFTGKDEVFYFIIPFGIPNIKNAVDKAIEAGNGTYLTDAVLEETSNLFMIGYKITGDVWAPATLGSIENGNVELLTLEELQKRNVRIK
ncbi:MAG: hypothetical protein HUU10_11845 [Bacteroidetes bacterium]|nr:hypothetical protein [Bacteroidota bacterium]